MLLEMEGGDSVLAALEEFSKSPTDVIPTVLEEYLLRVSKTGETLFPWAKCKALIQKKLDAAIRKFNGDMPYDGITAVPNAEAVCFEDMRTNILSAIDRFTGAPFTIQRLCELVTDPKRHYTRTDKFMRGLEKNVLVVTTVDPWGRKISSDKAVRAMAVNGLSPNSHGCASLKNSLSDSPSNQAPCTPDTKAEVAVSPVLPDSSSSNTSSSSSSSSTSSSNGEQGECNDIRASESSAAEATASASDTDAVIGNGAVAVKRPSVDGPTNPDTIPAKLPCSRAYHNANMGGDAVVAACGDVGQQPSSVGLQSSTESMCTDGDYCSADVPAASATSTCQSIEPASCSVPTAPTWSDSNGGRTNETAAELGAGTISGSSSGGKTDPPSVGGDGDSAASEVASLVNRAGSPSEFSLHISAVAPAAVSDST